VNRWLDQLGQPPITEQKLGETAQRLHTSLGDVIVVDLAGLPKNADPARDGRIVAAMLSTADSTLFFKMRGNAALVGAEKANFLKWIVAIRAGAGSESTAMPQLAAPMTDKPQIRWNVPPDWSPAPASAMRYASFAAPSDSNGKIDISVVTFPGDGGDDLGNINRWRQQLGLPPADANTSNIVPLKTNRDDLFPPSTSPVPTPAPLQPDAQRRVAPGSSN
jgi:hypothetical protein